MGLRYAIYSLPLIATGGYCFGEITGTFIMYTPVEGSGYKPMTKRVEFDDDGEEWIDINKRVNDAITERAMNNNERFGDALVAYITEQVQGNEEDN